MLHLRILTISLLLLPSPVLAAPKAEVAVLSTLHRVHADVPAYDFDALRGAIVELSPDVLCLEVDPTDLETRPDESVKVEYPRVVYPLLDERDYGRCALEPMPKAAAKIIQPYVAASRKFSAERREADAAFEAYNEAMYGVLKTLWQTPADVNSRVTDQVLGAKHALQIELIGEGEAAGWRAWNEHFLRQILRAAKDNPGKRIVVLVGVEHGYWLRGALANQKDVRLLDTAALLRKAGLGERGASCERRGVDRCRLKTPAPSRPD